MLYNVIVNLTLIAVKAFLFGWPPAGVIFFTAEYQLSIAVTQLQVHRQENT